MQKYLKIKIETFTRFKTIKYYLILFDNNLPIKIIRRFNAKKKFHRISIPGLPTLYNYKISVLIIRYKKN